MNIILLEPVNNLGDAGEIVRVKPGYARNYLVPNGLALPATRANQAELDARLEQRAKQLAERKADSERLKTMLGEAPTVEIKVRAGEDRIYGSVGNKDVAEAMQSTFDVEIDRRKLDLTHPIKNIGQYNVTYKPHPDVPIDITINIVAEVD